ncbi:MAG: hypothetical protein J6J43_03685 [Oscillospiraceae bacterium]|nr:hypothetical protein [Oscillospiraceae bacterium]
MKNRRLFRCMGQIDEDLIMEAELIRFKPRKRSILFHAAACLVLAGCLGLIIAVPRILSPLRTETPLTDQVETDVEEAAPSYFSFGGLSLNMTQEQVCTLLGEPEYISEEQSPRWFYPTLTVQFHASDLKVCRIWLLKGCELTMLNGIGVGSSEEHLKKAYPDLPVMQQYYKAPYVEDAYLEGTGDYREDMEDTQHQINTPDLSIRFGVSKGEIEYISLTRHTASEPNMNEDANVDDRCTFSFGGVSLDMTQEQVQELLGSPTEITDEESPRWFYPTHVIRFHAFDKTVSSIGILTGCQLKMENGIGLGSTDEDVLNAYPDAYVNSNYDEHTANTAYELFHDDLFLLIGTADGKVVYISLTCHKDPMLEALTSDTIKVYTPVDAGKPWNCVTLTGKAAKLVCTAMTISEPEAPTGEKTGLIQWLDFGNGTAAELYGNDHAAIFSYSGSTFDPSRTDGLIWRLSGCFYDLDDYVAQAIASVTGQTESE